MIVAMCLSMLAKPVFEDCAQFFKLIEKCAILRSSTVIYYKNSVTFYLQIYKIILLARTIIWRAIRLLG
jgi:hypothetical protein